jgi:TetR/AcrR family transcriptional regulator, regulator of cefoperazone and chloramphenicol sensitivity
LARTAGSSGPETRRRILSAAAELFAEQGFAGARMLDVATRLGISKSALYYHFASKEDLLEGLVEPIVKGLAAFTEGAESAAMSVEAIVRGYLDLLIAGAPGLYPVFSDPTVHDVFGGPDDLGNLIRRLEHTLALRLSSPQAHVRAEFVFGALRSVVIGRVREGTPIPDEAECETLVALALEALQHTPVPAT